MKTKPLTQTELATLASNLPTGTAKERVKMAYEIWEAADPVKAQHAFYMAKVEAMEAKGEEISRMIAPILEAASQKAKEKASNAAKARWNNTPEEKRRERKAGGKTQQVKKKAKS